MGIELTSLLPQLLVVSLSNQDSAAPPLPNALSRLYRLACPLAGSVLLSWLFSLKGWDTIQPSGKQIASLLLAICAALVKQSP